MPELSEMIRLARAAVVDAGVDPDSPSGVAAFTAAFERLSTGPSQTRRELRSEHEDDVGMTDDPASVAAEWLGVSREALLDAFDFGPDGVDLHVHSRVLPVSKSGRQRLLALTKLALDRVAYGRDDVDARRVNAVCERYDCMDQNLPGNLKNYENYITRRGQRGAYAYRITQFGLDEAQEAIRSTILAA
jgi:hypothetical protein